MAWLINVIASEYKNGPRNFTSIHQPICLQERVVDTTYIIIAEADRENVDDPPKKIPFSNRRWMLLGVGL